MIKQLKVYGLEESFNLPKLDYTDWSNEVALEFADHNLNFFNELLITKNKLFRLSDLINNKQEMIHAQSINFKKAKTRNFVSALLNLYKFSNELIEFSDIDAAEDIVVISHTSEKNNDSISLFILKKIMNVVLSDREVIEVLGKELTSFDYNKLANIVLSEDSLFTLSNLKDAHDEIKHALRYKFMSDKTMQFVTFLSTLMSSTKKEEKIIFLMDLLPIQGINT